MGTRWKKFSCGTPTKAVLWGVVLAAAAAGLYLFASVWLYAEPAAYKDSAQYVEDIAGGFSASLGYAAEGDKPDGSFPFLYCVTLEDGSVHANTLANAASVYDEELGYTVAVDLDGNVLLNLSPEAQSEALTIINGQDAQNAAAQGASESTDSAANAPNAIIADTNASSVGTLKKSLIAATIHSTMQAAENPMTRAGVSVASTEACDSSQKRMAPTNESRTVATVQ